MPVVQATARFRRVVRKLEQSRYDAVTEAIGRFCENPRHPGLNFEKIGGTTCCSIRIDGGWRIIMKRVGSELYDLLDVGNHDIYDKYS